MKRLIMIALIILLSISVGYLGFSYKDNKVPHIYYQVYLNDEKIGMIESKEELETYIDKQSTKYKKQYNVDKVYAPNGLEVKKINTYNDNIESVKDIYQKLVEKGTFTILGYQFNIKSEEDVKQVYVLNKTVFERAIEQTIGTFVGTTNYELYKNVNQKEITTTGSIIENIYVEDNITVKKVYIPVTEKIYTNDDDLAQFLLFGPNVVQESYTVKPGDTIDNVAFNNKISVEEFLISNPSFTSSSNLLFPGQEVVIGMTDPQIQVVIVEYSVNDQVSRYKTDEKFDSNRIKGDDVVIQKGENGLDRVTQRTKNVNGNIEYVETISKEELKPTINKVVLRGDKMVPNIGSLTLWAWPTESGWVISSGYGYRINPINGARELHDAIDIAGTGYGSNLYAANNGTVVEASYRYVNGNYIIINHNNGYYSYYGHLSKILVKKGDTVARGQVIGLVGSTGWSTGPHVHFAIYKNAYPFTGVSAVNPWQFY